MTKYKISYEIEGSDTGIHVQDESYNFVMSEGTSYRFPKNAVVEEELPKDNYTIKVEYDEPGLIEHNGRDYVEFTLTKNSPSNALVTIMAEFLDLVDDGVNPTMVATTGQ